MSFSISSGSPPTPPPTPTPDQNPTPEPTPTPEDGRGEGTGPQDAASQAIDASDQEPVRAVDETGASQLLSTAFPEAVPDPFLSDTNGWINSNDQVDPYTNVAARPDDVLGPYLGTSNPDTYSGQQSIDANSNAFTTGQSVNPFTGLPADTGPDTSQWLASNDQSQQQLQQAIESGRLGMVPMGVDPNTGLQQWAVYVDSKFVTFVNLPVTASSSSSASATAPSPSPRAAPTPPAPVPAPAPPTAAPSPTQAPLPPLPPPPSETAQQLPSLPAPSDQSAVPGAQTSAASPSTQAVAPTPPPSLAEQIAPSADSPSWRQYDWAVQQMLDPTNPWYGRAGAGVGAAASAIYATAERFALAPALKGLGNSLQGLSMATHDVLHGVGLSDLDISNVDLFMWERDAPAAIADAAAAVGPHLDAALSRIPLPGSGGPRLGIPPGLTGDASGLGGGGARNASFSYGPLPPGINGSTSPLGNITIAPGLPPGLEAEVLRHESVHAFLSPGPGPLQQARANLMMWGYTKSNFLRYTEEALAHGYATRSLSTGLAFPLTHPYGITPLRLGLETAGVTVIIGAGVIGSYELLR